MYVLGLMGLAVYPDEGESNGEAMENQMEIEPKKGF